MYGQNQQSDVHVKPPARVVAVDDHPPFLTLVRDLVDMTPRLEIVGEADSGERAEEICCQMRPDMVVMDVHMTPRGGIEAAKQIKASLPGTLVVLMSTTSPDDLPTEARDVCDTLLWKSELSPSVLEGLWTDHDRK